MMLPRLKTIIIDDERLSLDLIRNMLNEHCPEIDIVGEADNLGAGLELCKKMNPDVVLLDIEISGDTGFDLLVSLPKRAFHTVFITAHSKYAIQAIKSRVDDYILKPVDKDELVETVNRLVKKQAAKVKERADFAQYNEQRLIFPHYNGFKMTSLKNIIRLEASDNYTLIHTTTEKIVVSKTLKEFEKTIVNDWFIRIHKSHIININHLKEYISDDGHFALMADGFKASVSKSRQVEFLDYLNKYLGGNNDGN
jgi:two-component system, LytTR family, response regulator